MENAYFKWKMYGKEKPESLQSTVWKNYTVNVQILTSASAALIEIRTWYWWVSGGDVIPE